MRWARRNVDRRWAMRMVVRSAISERRVAWMASSVVASTAEVASSSTRMRGSVRMARASANRWRCPPDRVTPRSPTTVS